MALTRAAHGLGLNRGALKAVLHKPANTTGGIGTQALGQGETAPSMA